MARARKTQQATGPGKRPIEQYDHRGKQRKNNPPVGLVTEATDRDAPKRGYAYDPHLDPALTWAGKAEHTSFEVPTVSLHVHERIDPKTIMEAVRRRNGAPAPAQGSLFESPEENPPLREAIDFYQHAHAWSNRLVAGDSLLVMNSLLEKEGLGGKVQMVYIDPPYGIRYGSNFQPFVNKRDVKDGSDEDLTQEPEMIRAFRDTWELGIHYLTYLRDRLLLARDLLRRLVVGDALERHVRDDLAFETAAHAFRRVRQLVVVVDGRHQPLLGEGDRHARRVARDPPPPPLFGDVSRRARAARWIEDKVARVRRHQHAALDHRGARLHHVDLRRGARDVVPDVRHFVSRKVVQVAHISDRAASLHDAPVPDQAFRCRLPAGVWKQEPLSWSQETLHDQPRVDGSRVRVTGPFTVEAVPAPTVRPLTEAAGPQAADASVVRSGETLRQAEWRAELLKTGIRGKNNQMILFSRVEPLAGTRWLHADAETRPNERGSDRVSEPRPGAARSAERVVVSFGPEHAPLEQRQVEMAWEEARTLAPRPAILVFAAFQFDPEAAKDIDELTREKTGMTFLKVQMNADLLTADLKKKRASNESFWLMGQPDVTVGAIGRGEQKGKLQVEVHGFDYYNTKTGQIESGDTGRIALWMLDPDYDGRSLFPRQVFFPMTDEAGGWARLARNLKAEVDEERIETYRGTVSLPFEPGLHRRVAVKIVDDRGIESLKVIPLP